MSFQSLTGFLPLEHAGRASHLFSDIQTVRILIYTDDPFQAKEDETAPFGIGLMKRFLEEHQPTFAKIAPPTLESRNISKDPRDHAAKKLTQLLSCSDYDQIWFFGFHLANLTEVVWDLKTENGGPESELTDVEVAYLLEEWMKTGGVLVTGDHSEPTPVKVATPGLPKLLSLGRALGHRVPRACQLRTWDGGPGRDPQSSYNTQEPNCGGDLNAQLLEQDGKPQNIILPRFNLEGTPSPEGHPHSLFKDRNNCEIEVFPDHMHEGEVMIPYQLNDEWPIGGPEPRVIAVGTDKRNGKTYNLVAIYDGDQANVGRIAVDSTWHHYFNMNLAGFTKDLGEGSAADRIGQYYSNLAVWLAPLAKRQKMAQAMFWWLANHPRIIEEANGSALDIGRIALQYLASVATPSEIHELLLAYTPESLIAKFEKLSYTENLLPYSRFPSQELVLGAVICQYHQEMATVADDKLLAYRGKREVSDVIKEGFKQAFYIHAEMSGAAMDMARTHCEYFE